MKTGFALLDHVISGSSDLKVKLHERNEYRWIMGCEVMLSHVRMFFLEAEERSEGIFLVPRSEQELSNITIKVLTFPRSFHFKHTFQNTPSSLNLLSVCTINRVHEVLAVVHLIILEVFVNNDISSPTIAEDD